MVENERNGYIAHAVNFQGGVEGCAAALYLDPMLAPERISFLAAYPAPGEERIPSPPPPGFTRVPPKKLSQKEKKAASAAARAAGGATRGRRGRL